MDEHGRTHGGYFAHSAAQNDVQKTVVVPQIQYIAVCDAKTSSHNLVCSETVEVLQNAENRNGGRCPCRDALALSPPFNTKKRCLSPSESFVKNQVACVVRIVLCEIRVGRKKTPINVVSPPLTSFFL